MLIGAPLAERRVDELRTIILLACIRLAVDEALLPASRN
jgi:hypothetical protein